MRCARARGRPLGPDARRDAARRERHRAASGDPVERRPQRRGVRGARARGAGVARDHRQSRDARLHRAEAALGARARARRLRARAPRAAAEGLAAPAHDRRRRDRLLRRVRHAVARRRATRRWSPAMLAACGLDERAMPRVFEGSEATGRLRAEVASAWGVRLRSGRGGRGRPGRRRRRRGRRAAGRRVARARHLGRPLRRGRSLPAESRARRARVLPLPAGRAGTRCRCCSRRRAVSPG